MLGYPATVSQPGPGDPLAKRATLRDVARVAGVSRSTASRALSRQGYVAATVRRRVEQVAEGIGYVPDATAQYLKSQVSNSIGVLVSDLSNSFYADLAAGVSQQARRRGCHMMLIDNRGVGTAESGVAQTFVSLRLAGAIVTPVSADLGEVLRRQRLPVVEVDRQFAAGTCDAVVVDNRDQAQEVTRILIGLGHRRIALLIDETDWTTGRDRRAGYVAALEQAGLPIEPDLVVPSGWDVHAAGSAARALLTTTNPPTAVFAVNNVLAEGVWRTARELRLSIPDQLSLVSFDDAPWMSMVDPGVSAVAQDVLRLGATALDLLLERVAAPAAPARTVVVPTRMASRGSVGPAP